MLDLSILKDKTYDIKLENGEILHIKKPTQRMMKDIINMNKLLKGGTEIFDEMQDIMFDYTTQIFNYNIDGKEFTKEQLEDMFDASVAMYIVTDYLKFTSKILSDPN